MISRPNPSAIAGLLALVLALAALVGFALPTKAVAADLPPGSYKGSCSDIYYFANRTLSAICRRKDGNPGPRTKLQQAQRCPWIVNNDGVLACASAHELCERRCRDAGSRRPGAYDSCMQGCGP